MSPGQIVAAVAAPSIAAVALWRRGALGRERLLLVLGLSLVVAVYASGVLARLPDVQPLLAQLAQTLGRWTYLLVGALAFLETGAFVGFSSRASSRSSSAASSPERARSRSSCSPPSSGSPPSSATRRASFSGASSAAASWSANGPRFRITERRLAEVEDYLDRYGAPTIVVGRFAIVAEIAAEATLVFGVVILVAATGLYLHRRITVRRAGSRSSPDSE